MKRPQKGLGCLQVREGASLTGSPSLFRSQPRNSVGSPNAAERPRMMLTFRYERSDLLHEVADAFGWR